MSKLIEIAQAVVKNPAFIARGKETYCNFGLQLIAEAAFNYDQFNGLTANLVYAKVSKEWQKVNAKEAHTLSASRFVIAAQSGQAHGHVAVVVPLTLHYSGKWAKDAPTVANVGVKNGVMGANFAFAEEPEYFVK
jgi:hypothetical protein